MLNKNTMEKLRKASVKAGCTLYTYLLGSWVLVINAFAKCSADGHLKNDYPLRTIYSNCHGTRMKSLIGNCSTGSGILVSSSTTSWGTIQEMIQHLHEDVLKAFHESFAFDHGDDKSSIENERAQDILRPDAIFFHS